MSNLPIRIDRRHALCVSFSTLLNYLRLTGVPVSLFPLIPDLPDFLISTRVV
jgi:hypothetical protein